MYQCLTGTLPFQEFRCSRVAVMYKTTHERPESPRSRAPERDIAPEVDALVMRAMEVNRELRFATVAELGEAIRLSLRTPGATPRGGGSLVSGSILELTPPAAISSVAKEAMPKSIILAASGSELPAPARPEDQAASTQPGANPKVEELPTSIQDTSRRASMSVLGILLAMVLGLVVLLALIVRETGATRKGSEDQPPAAANPLRTPFTTVPPGPKDDP